MPFITARVNTAIDAEQEKELKTRMGKAIELVPGKSEEYLLLNFEDHCHLYLRGDNSRPIAYIEVSIWANENHLGYDRFSLETARIFHEVLDIEPDHIYIRYSDIPDWSVGGMNFDRNRYR